MSWEPTIAIRALRPTTVSLGRRAERQAQRHLERNGLRLVARNFRAPGGELDLVMLQGQLLVFVEVRARARRDWGSAADTVDGRKRRRIAQAALYFLSRHPEHGDRAMRFDVVTVEPREPSGINLGWIVDAFRIGD